MSRRLLVIGLVAASILGHRVAAQNCSVDMPSVTQAGGQIAVHAEAKGTPNPWPCGEPSPLSLDIQFDGDSWFGSRVDSCTQPTSCKFDGTLNTYCFTPGVTHTISATCHMYPGCGLTVITKTSSFVVDTPAPPTISASWAANVLSYSWARSPYAFGNSIDVVVDGSDNGGPSNIDVSGSSTMNVSLSPCSSHTIDANIRCCANPNDTAHWTGKATVTVPDAANPTVSIRIDPNNGSYAGTVTYTFPSVGSRTLKVVRKAKPPYSLSDTDVVPASSPANPSGTLPFTPDSTSGDEIYEAIATSGECNPAHENRADAGLNNANCCPIQRPNGGGPWPFPNGILAAGGVGSPVRLTTGNMHYTDAEPLSLPLMPLTRTYDSANGTVGVFGTGWTSLLDAGAVVIGT